MHLCQAKYIKDLLDKVQLKDSKPNSTLMFVGTSLLKDDNAPLANATQFHTIMGAL